MCDVPEIVPSLDDEYPKSGFSYGDFQKSV